MSKRKIPRAHSNARSYKGQSKPFTELAKDNRYGGGRRAHAYCASCVHAAGLQLVFNPRKA